MKTFKQHVKEHKGSEKTAAAVGSQTTNSVEDSSIGAHNIQDEAVLQRVNGFVIGVLSLIINNASKSKSCSIASASSIKGSLKIFISYLPDSFSKSKNC